MEKFLHQETLSETRRHVILSVNPKAGRRSSKMLVERLENALKELGFTVETLTDLDVVAHRANETHLNGTLRALIGVGGDGTAAELTNRTQPGVPISLLATGTANLLAKHMKYSFRPEKFAKMIAAGKVVTVDAARANGRLFLAMIGCGFDADVVRQVHKARMENKKNAHISYFSYIKPILRSIAGYGFPLIRVEELDESGMVVGEAKETHWAFLCNIPRYGWGVPVAPGAKLDDGKLDLCLWRGGSLFQGLYLTALVQMGIHGRFRRCMLCQGKRFRFTSLEPDREIPFQLDGDPGGNIPVEIEILPNRLTIFVPEK
ncbi:MAG: diacylglycerol kinase family protein [Planctomycetia bacterium]|nr:diacylglycerol kinase family protein [Planctomycetia bacterium]